MSAADAGGDMRPASPDVSATQASEPVDSVGDAGIGVASVVVMLAMQAVLVVGIFWLLPAYFGGGVVEVTIRN